MARKDRAQAAAEGAAPGEQAADMGDQAKLPLIAALSAASVAAQKSGDHAKHEAMDRLLQVAYHLQQVAKAVEGSLDGDLAEGVAAVLAIL